MKKFFIVIAALSAALGAAAAEFAAQHNWVIVTGEKLSAIEKTAAEELKLHLEKTFTAPVKLNGAVPQKIRFFVGATDEAKKANFSKVTPAGDLPGKFGIVRSNNDFLFYGYDTANGSAFVSRHSCGTLIAVEYFAQKYLQAKFFLPGAAGSKYALNPEIKFTGAVDAPKPAYEVRGFQSVAKGVKADEMMLLYRRRLGMVPEWSVRDYYYTFLNKWNKRFKDKPEMFGLYGGKRINTIYPRHFPCTSNPAVLKQVVEDLNKELAKKPSIKVIRFFSDAPVRSCGCDNCRNSTVGKLASAANDSSETVYAFYSKIGKELQKTHPDLIFHIQTKGNSYKNPPQSEKLPANTVIALLTGHYNPPDYYSVQKRSEAWKAAGAAHVVLHCYPRPPGMKDYPIVNPHRIAEHFKKLQGYAAGLIRAEGSAKISYTFSALNNYIHSAVMFDSSIDTDALIREFCQLVSPAAAVELQTFYNEMENLLKGAGFWDDPIVNCYLSFRLKTPREWLNKALAKDKTNAFLQQLDKDFARFEGQAAAAIPKDFTAESLEKFQQEQLRRLPMLKLTDKVQNMQFIPFSLYQGFQNTQVGLVKTDGKLVIKLDCSEKNVRKLVAKSVANHAGEIWNDDVVEIFFSAPGTEMPYTHLAVNSRGVHRVLGCDKAGKVIDLKDFQLTTSAAVKPGMWSAEVAIPLAELQKIAVNGKVAVGMFRFRPARKGERLGQRSCLQKPFGGSFRDQTGRFEVEL